MAFPEEVTAPGVENFQDEKLREKLSQLGFHMLVYIPLSTKGSKLGFFILGKHEPEQLSHEELSLLSSIGKQIGVSMENARLYEQAEEGANTAERHRLARELHDAVTQTLFSANLIADVLPRIWKRSPEEGMQNLEELRQLTRGALAEMRTLLLELRPSGITKHPLGELLAQLAEAITSRSEVSFQLLIDKLPMLPEDIQTSLYISASSPTNSTPPWPTSRPRCGSSRSP